MGVEGYGIFLVKCSPDTLGMDRPGPLLKEHGLTLIVTEIWPLLLFTIVVLTIGIRRYRGTLD